MGVPPRALTSAPSRAIENSVSIPIESRSRNVHSSATDSAERDILAVSHRRRSMLSTNRSIVMVDWSRINEPAPRTRAEFLWHQMLLSLLYDDVFAQDEILVCSKKMARWFRDNESFRLLEEAVESGGMGVLKRPYERYPPELQERALEQPVTTRREHVERFSVNNDGTPLRFDGTSSARSTADSRRSCSVIHKFTDTLAQRKS